MKEQDYLNKARTFTNDKLCTIRQELEVTLAGS